MGNKSTNRRKVERYRSDPDYRARELARNKRLDALHADDPDYKRLRYLHKEIYQHRERITRWQGRIVQLKANIERYDRELCDMVRERERLKLSRRKPAAWIVSNCLFCHREIKQYPNRASRKLRRFCCLECYREGRKVGMVTCSKAKVWEFDGESHTAAEWAKLCGVTVTAMRERFTRGLPPVGPDPKAGKLWEHNGESHTATAWAKMAGMGYRRMRKRLEKGLPPL